MLKTNDLNKDLTDLDSHSLIDCYRIALDFGMPAALKAMEHLQKSEMAEEELEPSPAVSNSTNSN